MHATVILAFFAASVLSTAEGSFRIDQLRPPRPANVGLSQFLIVRLVDQSGLYKDIFPNNGPKLKMQMDRKSAGRTLANVHGPLTDADRTLANAVRGYVGSVLIHYNRKALATIRKVQMKDVHRAVKMTVTAYGFPFFAYLNDAGKDVKSLFDNTLLYYSNTEFSMPENYYMVNRIETFERVIDTEWMRGVKDGTKSDNGVLEKLSTLAGKLHDLARAFRATHPQWLCVQNPEIKPESLSSDLRGYMRIISKLTCTFEVRVLRYS